MNLTRRSTVIGRVPQSKLRPGDVARVGVSGIRSRKLRATLSALGIAIGVASLVGVLGLSESSKSDLLDQLAALGTNLLVVQAGSGFGFGDASLPETARGMVDRVGTVEQVASTVPVEGGVYRSDFVPEGQTGGMTIVAADETLIDALNGSMADGVFLGGASSEYPAVVLGSEAAQRLGITEVGNGTLIWMAGKWVEVIGILDPFVLAPDLDRSVFISLQVAIHYFDSEGIPTALYLRVDPDWVNQTRDLLPATVDPESPEEVEVTRPSDVLEAEAAAESAFSGLFLGLGAVALLVGGIGIANVMVIGVIERRGEIGLRRAIGATRAHIRRQFLTESLILSAIGGLAGLAIGSAVTAGYSTLQGWRIIIPAIAIGGGLVAALLIGAGAGIYPAMRAARMSPTEALRAE
jgi:putative ABC transport system permease protein